MVNASDPEANGIVKSLARPDGNITGTSNLTGQLGAKNLEVLLDIAPNLRRIAALHDPTVPATATILRNIHAAAAKAGVSMIPVAARTSEELKDAFPTMVRQGADAVIIVAGGLFRQEIKTIAALCIKH